MLALVVGFRPDANIAEYALALALLVFSAYCFTWVFITIGLISKSAQAAQRDVAPWSSSRSPSSPPPTCRPTPSPGGCSPSPTNQPFTVLANALRSLTLGGADAVGLDHGTAYWVLLSVVWFAGIFVVFSMLSVRRFSRRR